jgi:hypothetical protein
MTHNPGPQMTQMTQMTQIGATLLSRPAAANGRRPCDKARE